MTGSLETALVVVPPPHAVGSCVHLKEGAPAIPSECGHEYCVACVGEGLGEPCILCEVAWG